jgi:hypothetical protein
MGIGGEIPDAIPDGAIVEVRLEPSPDAARDTVDIFEILDHTFLLPGVVVKR